MALAVLQVIANLILANFKERNYFLPQPEVFLKHYKVQNAYTAYVSIKWSTVDKNKLLCPRILFQR